MFLPKKSSKNRSRQPAGTLNESFRRNNVVVSRSQREISARQQSVTQRQIDKKKRASRQQTKARVIAVLIIVLGICTLWRLGITNVRVTTAPGYTVPATGLETYQATIAKEYRAHTILGQSWLLDEAEFKQAVMLKHPEIASLALDIHTPVSTQLGAMLTFRQPVFTWVDASKQQRFIDSSGVLFTVNLDKTINEKKLVHIEDQSGAVLTTGTSVLTTSLIQFVGQLHTKLPPLYSGTPISRVVIPKSTREVQVQMDKSPYILKFSSERSVDGVVGELSALLNYLKSENIAPTSYIDLRVPNRAFYK